MPEENKVKITVDSVNNMVYSGATLNENLENIMRTMILAAIIISANVQALDLSIPDDVINEPEQQKTVSHKWSTENNCSPWMSGGVISTTSSTKAISKSLMSLTGVVADVDYIDGPMFGIGTRTK